MGYQHLVSKIDEWCGGDISQMEMVATYLTDYIAQIKEYTNEDQMLIHGFCN